MIFNKAFAAVVTAASLLVQDAIAHRGLITDSLKRSPYVVRSSSRTPCYTNTIAPGTWPTRPFDVSFVISTTQQKDPLVAGTEPRSNLAETRRFIFLPLMALSADLSLSRGKTTGCSGARALFGETGSRNGSMWAGVGFKVRRDRLSVSGDPELDDGDDEYMVVWRDTDIQSPGRDDLKRDLDGAVTCGSDNLLHNKHENNIVYRSMDEAIPDTSAWQISPRALFGRQADTSGGNGAGRALGSEKAVTDNVLQLVNAASQLYESTFNISLALQNLTISDAGCPSTPPPSAPWNRPCNDGTDVDARLSLFSQWRGQWQDTNAFWTLLSTCGSGPTVGLAWLGAVCQQGSSTRGNETSASANVVVRTSTEWLVFAHETGHTFGAVHDCDSRTCNDGSVQRQECCPLGTGTCDADAQFIMNPSTGNGITQFSPCSIGNICSFLGRTPNRVCDPSSEECCTSQCSFMNNGTVCRASTGSCDPQETCSGNSAGCPADLSAPDGQSCGDNGLQCASGRCTSRDQQCATFMGADTTTSCSSSGCGLSCHSSKLGANQCYVLNQYFLDGTPCEGGGRCDNGNCVGSSLTQQILDWINNNKQISIPVFCVGGGLLLLVLISCCWSCFSRRSRSRKAAPSPPRGGWGGNPYYGARGVPGGGGPGGGSGSGGSTPMRPGPSYAPVPPPPQGTAGMGPGPDPYYGQQGQQQGQRWEPMRTQSFRYA
ncbi:hypothetical protein CHGG_10194 [Chaetomium globosum CBS 148.51]|uniref:Peptidase M12B domain-containing protein n=1 Tax=Chaetomium globosum (strain ATCC 6205 / CBS 148.51 / DSM 1962 / NBRC 6347 / NRRL 1970) TaxID=306901 RepID=Q2GPB0_CHAGB|nr:uncharacterized protein CHGG_10194 [Chaetomium globosum CBS 148.51]EAQ83790.1 hypothetical protein CHGG_10194 [Chaetomium globosum CBS 148.51]